MEATIIIDSIGLSPLLFATLGMLSRLYRPPPLHHGQFNHTHAFFRIDWINIASPGRFGIKQFRLVQLLISLGLILSIVGGTSSTPDPNTGKVSIPTTSRVGIILYIVAFLAIGLITLISAPSLAVVPVPERKILAAIVLSFPFIFTRLLYSALSVFVGGHHFSVVDGSVAVLVAMAAVEEFIVVFIYLVLGFKLEHQTTDQQGPIASRPWKGRKNGPENRRHRSHGGSRSRERATTAPIGLERYQREQV